MKKYFIVLSKNYNMPASCQLFIIYWDEVEEITDWDINFNRKPAFPTSLTLLNVCFPSLLLASNIFFLQKKKNRQHTKTCPLFTFITQSFLFRCGGDYNFKAIFTHNQDICPLIAPLRFFKEIQLRQNCYNFG